MEGRSLDLCNLFETSTIEKFLTTKTDNGATYFYVPRTATNSQQNLPLTESSIYVATSTTIDNNFKTAYLILSSFLFDTEKVLEEEIGDDYTKMIRLPYPYMLWLGGKFL